MAKSNEGCQHGLVDGAGNEAMNARRVAVRVGSMGLLVAMLVQESAGQAPQGRQGSPEARARAVITSRETSRASAVGRAAANESRQLEAPLPTSLPTAPDEAALPIDLAGVLELARASNLEIRKAAERVNEAHVQLALAKTQWLPSLNIGSSWLKHEGRTQEIPGQIITASKGALFAGGIANATLDPQKTVVEILRARQQIYAQSGALDRATRQSLHDASLAYVDLVAAQAGVAISVELSDLIEELVKRSEQLLKQGVGAEVEVLSNQVRLESQRQKLIGARRDQLAAGANLVQLLHLPAVTRLYANEPNLAPLALVDENTEEAEMVRIALDQGPGLAEVVALVSAIEEQKKQVRRIMFLPTIAMSVGEGTFGGGIGGQMRDFGNSLDVGVSAYWDVMRVVGTSRTRDLFESKRRQVLLQHDEVTSKLATGVVVARHTAIQAREKIQMAEREINTAIRAYRLSQSRLQAAETNSSEVLQAIGALGTARANYLAAVIEYNRAQIQLQYLLGQHLAGPHGADPDGACPPGADCSRVSPAGAEPASTAGNRAAGPIPTAAASSPAKRP